jgi:hypothetical protein
VALSCPATQTLHADFHVLLNTGAGTLAPQRQSRARSGKSTGNLLNVDGGVPAAYAR